MIWKKKKRSQSSATTRGKLPRKRQRLSYSTISSFIFFLPSNAGSPSSRLCTTTNPSLSPQLPPVSLHQIISLHPLNHGLWISVNFSSFGARRSKSTRIWPITAVNPNLLPAQIPRRPGVKIIFQLISLPIQQGIRAVGIKFGTAKSTEDAGLPWYGRWVFGW